MSETSKLLAILITLKYVFPKVRLGAKYMRQSLFDIEGKVYEGTSFYAVHFIFEIQTLFFKFEL